MTSGSGYDDVVIIRLKILSYTGQIKTIVGSKYRLRYVYLIAHSVSTVYCLPNLCVIMCIQELAEDLHWPLLNKTLKTFFPYIPSNCATLILDYRTSGDTKSIYH